MNLTQKARHIRNNDDLHLEKEINALLEKGGMIIAETANDYINITHDIDISEACHVMGIQPHGWQFCSQHDFDSKVFVLEKDEWNSYTFWDTMISIP